MQPYIRIPRQILDSNNFKSARNKYKLVLIKLAELACYKKKIILVKDQIIEIEPGTLYVSLSEMVKIMNDGVVHDDEKYDKSLMQRIFQFWVNSDLLSIRLPIQSCMQGKTLVTIKYLDTYEKDKIGIDTAFDTAFDTALPGGKSPLGGFPLPYTLPLPNPPIEKDKQLRCDSANREYGDSVAQPKNKLFLDRKNQTFGGVTQDDIECWREIFPNVIDIDKEVKKCAVYALCYSRYNVGRKYLFEWMVREDKYQTEAKLRHQKMQFIQPKTQSRRQLYPDGSPVIHQVEGLF